MDNNIDWSALLGRLLRTREDIGLSHIPRDSDLPPDYVISQGYEHILKGSHIYTAGEPVGRSGSDLLPSGSICRLVALERIPPRDISLSAVLIPKTGKVYMFFASRLDPSTILPETTPPGEEGGERRLKRFLLIGGD